MPLDSSIPLKVKSLDLATPLLQFTQLKRQGEQDAIVKKQGELDSELKTQQLANAKFEAMGARDKARLTSTVMGAAQLDTHLQAGDIKGAQSFLENRRKELGQRIAAGEQVDTTETDEALQLLKDDPKHLQEITGNAIKLGKLTGILKTDSQLSGFASIPAALQITNAYNEALESGDNDKANQILMFTKSLEKGQTLDANGNIIPVPGALENKQDVEKAKETGKKEVQLQYEPTIEGNKAKAKSDAEFKAKAQQNLPQALDNADYMLNLLDEVKNHPGMPGMVGVKGARTGFIGYATPGTPEAGFAERLSQINGGTFLQAYESLKGTGQITEKEGEKATQAKARMGTAQREEDFVAAAEEYQSIIRKAVMRAKAAAGSNVKGEDSPPEYGNNISEQTPAEKVASSLPEENIPTGGNIHALPQGAKQIGTSGGKPVFQTPDGKKFVQD